MAVTVTVALTVAVAVAVAVTIVLDGGFFQLEINSTEEFRIEIISCLSKPKVLETENFHLLSHTSRIQGTYLLGQIIHFSVPSNGQYIINTSR